MGNFDTVLAEIDQNRARCVEALKEFLRIPSVSTKPEQTPDMRRCAGWLAEQIRAVGLEAGVEEGGGHPVVLARNERRAGRPTVLFYGHYDVQPPEPLEQWTTPPFEPTERQGAIYARGACDDKGQVWAHVEALRAWQKHGGLPVNIVMLIEGEEEIGSDHLDQFLEKRKAELKADVAVISDTGQFARGLPAITYGLRGLVYMEVFVSGASHDLHSGMYGGAVPNPANVLCELMASLHLPDGRVNIPGFYDDVVPLTVEERQQWARLPFDEAAYIRELQVPGLCGESGFTSLERAWGRPTCDINGLSGGYEGPGAKTIIPSTALAKVSMRLVPNQDPHKIRAAFEDALRRRCPKTVTIKFASHGLGGPVMVPMNGPAMKLARSAVKRGFGTEPVMIREGGSIPVVAQIKSVLGMDSLLVGFALPDDRVHSPNEKFDLDALYKGCRTAAALYDELSRL